MPASSGTKMAGLPFPSSAGHSSRGSLPSLFPTSPSSFKSLLDLNGVSGILSHGVALYLAVPIRRRFIITALFLLGLLFTVTMKREHLLWLFTANAGAAPLLEWGQGTVFDYPGLRFGMDRTFSITVFSDLHFGEPDSVMGPQADTKTLDVMNTVLRNEKSNLVVLNGDLVTCEDVATENVTSVLDQVVSPLVHRRLPFATTFGNHDMSRSCNTSSMAEHLENVHLKKSRKLSWAKPMVFGPLDQLGTSNYYIPVYSSRGGGNPKLVMMLWFFDSRGGRAFGQTGSDGQDVPVGNWVDQKVVSWFRLTSSTIHEEHKRVIPSLAFVHIPVHATLAYQKKGTRTVTTEPGIDAEVIGHQGDSCDSTGNNCTYGGNDIPFMKALTETEGLMAVFSGHDHGVDWCMKWDQNEPLPDNDPILGNGIHFCFNRHSGYGGYSDWTRGARQIVIEEDKLGKNELETWIRLEDGTVSGKVTLNATYGKDQYTPVKKTRTKLGQSPKVAPVISSSTSPTLGSTASPKLKPKLGPKAKPKSKPVQKSVSKSKHRESVRDENFN